MTPTQAKDKPDVVWPAEDGAYYTLMKIDPDAPSRENPGFRSISHWIVINIPGSMVKDGDEVIEYIGAGPPLGMGLHRYVYLIYKQPNGKIQYDEPWLTKK